MVNGKVLRRTNINENKVKARCDRLSSWVRLDVLNPMISRRLDHQFTAQPTCCTVVAQPRSVRKKRVRSEKSDTDSRFTFR